MTVKGSFALAACAAVVGACAKVELPPEPAPGCATSAALDGTGAATAMTISPPLALGTADVCLRLDATRNLVQAHLAVSVGAMTDGATTPFRSTLVDETGAVVVTGWDVAVSGRAFHDLEWSLDAGEVREVTLRVSRAGAVAPTPISISLFEPLE